MGGQSDAGIYENAVVVSENNDPGPVVSENNNTCTPDDHNKRGRGCSVDFCGIGFVIRTIKRSVQKNKRDRNVAREAGDLKCWGKTKLACKTCITTLVALAIGLG